LGFLPLGEGLLVCSSLDEAVAALESVKAHCRRHAAAAREIAESEFDLDRVLTAVVERVLE
jgi:hypothetical protein